MYTDDDVQPEVAIFEMFKSQDTGLLPIDNFLCALKATGIREDDPRLKTTFEMLKPTNKSNENQELNLENFTSIVSPSIGLLSRAFIDQCIVPEFQDFCNDIDEIYWKCKDNQSGTVRFLTLITFLTFSKIWTSSIKN
ncbi:unnamed protein product [Brassicogethes aeneus]|uniref:Glutaminase EF-hand domain-containing protein n=1 Tax=Brassicogethes aeneus TaxID=1431903 RepID=A0A9P0FCA3_BRAAE|nr:unnamed protein product [Brassicogethes aeneus]